jgi:hypothetical protein
MTLLLLLLLLLPAVHLSQQLRLPMCPLLPLPLLWRPRQPAVTGAINHKFTL